ncbi:hypothetical protein U1Q18_018692 [Sarracenia purpurea var. burkii]
MRSGGRKGKLGRKKNLIDGKRSEMEGEQVGGFPAQIGNVEANIKRQRRVTTDLSDFLVFSSTGDGSYVGAPFRTSVRVFLALSPPADVADFSVSGT